MSDLLPCPFCGELPAVESTVWLSIVVCHVCDARVCATRHEDAAAIWNSRPLERRLHGLIDLNLKYIDKIVDDSTDEILGLVRELNDIRVALGLPVEDSDILAEVKRVKAMATSMSECQKAPTVSAQNPEAK